MYTVKIRDLAPAKRNPYRPQQKIKRGPWKTYLSTESWTEAKAACERMGRGFREAAVFLGSKLFCLPNEYTGRLPADPPPPEKSFSNGY